MGLNPILNGDDLMDTISFSIITRNGEKSERIDFELSNDFGDISGRSFNPVNMWTGYSQFDRGWSEQDEELNEMLRAIKEYSLSEELTDLILNVDVDDIGKIYKRDYFCNQFVDENKKFSFDILITDAEFGPN